MDKFRLSKACDVPGATLRQARGVSGTRERGSPPAAKTKPKPPAAPALKITNGDRIIDTASGAAKEALVVYYAAAGSVMLPHLMDRPTSLVRAPASVNGELFVQKHNEFAKLREITRYPVDIHPDHPPMLSIGTMEDLLATAQ